MKLPWTKPRTATLTELREQHEHAIAAHSAAVAAVESAQTAFDDSGDDSASKTLLKARESAALAGEHLGRAERLLAAAEQADSDRQIAARHAELDAVESELSEPDPAEQALLDQELEIVDALIAARMRRLEQHDARDRKITRYRLACEELGRKPTGIRNSMSVSVSAREAISARARQAPSGPERDFAAGLAQVLGE